MGCFKRFLLARCNTYLLEFLLESRFTHALSLWTLVLFIVTMYVIEWHTSWLTDIIFNFDNWLTRVFSLLFRYNIYSASRRWARQTATAREFYSDKRLNLLVKKRTRRSLRQFWDSLASYGWRVPFGAALFCSKRWSRDGRKASRSYFLRHM